MITITCGWCRKVKERIDDSSKKETVKFCLCDECENKIKEIREAREEDKEYPGG
jgi:hypothetical protein